MNSLRKKISIQFFASNIATAINFLLSVILSRMMTPAEIGIFSMAAVVVGLAHVFRDFGVASFIKSQKELDTATLRSAMGVLIFSSWSISALLFLSSWPVAEFYHQSGVRPTLQVLAVGFLFIPFGSISQAVLARDLHAEKSAIVTIICTVTYFCVSLAFAYAGLSYMTMAWANLVNIIVSALAFTAVRPSGMPWLPSLRGWGQVIHFGTGAIVTTIVKSIDEAIGDLVLGRLSSSHFVGIFSRANSTVNISSQVLRPTIDFVALPYLSKVHHGGANLSQNVTRSTAYLTSLFWPALLTTAVYATDIIQVLYGRRWLEAAVAIPWLCLAVGARVTFHLVQPSVTGIGRPYWAAVPIGFGVILKVVLAVTMFDGTLLSFGRAIAFAEIAAASVYVLTASRVLKMNFLEWFFAVRESAVVLIGVLLALVALTSLHTAASSPVLRLLVAGSVLLPVWIALCYFTAHPIRAEFSYFAGYLRRSQP